MMDETGEVVSVPSRGLSYLNSSSCWLSSSSFSSFRPLTGTLLSKPLESIDAGRTPEDESFRPLTGTLLSKLYRIYELTDEAKSFRPLTGTLLSKPRAEEQWIVR